MCIGIVAAQATPLAATKIPNATKRMPRQLTQMKPKVWLFLLARVAALLHDRGHGRKAIR